MATIISKDPTVSQTAPAQPLVEGAITSANENPEPTPSIRALRRKALEEGAFIHDEAIIAKPLTIPGQNIKPARVGITLRWVNCRAGNGLQFERMRICGFQVATDKDAKCLDIPFLNGAYHNGDVILMFIATSQYQAALKYNAELAMRRVGNNEILKQGKDHLNEALAGATPELKKKISAFAPTEAEIGR